MENEKKEYEKCILCGVETNIEKNKNVENRYGYLEGAGQMCSKCFLDYYKKVHIKDDDTK
jgi:hypothetical protein